MPYSPNRKIQRINRQPPAPTAPLVQPSLTTADALEAKAGTSWANAPMNVSSHHICVDLILDPNRAEIGEFSDVSKLKLFYSNTKKPLACLFVLV